MKLAAAAAGVVAALLGLASPDGAHAQVTAFAGLTGYRGNLPAPYNHPCTRHDGESTFDGFGAYAGIRRNRLSVQAGYVHGSQQWDGRCLWAEDAPIFPNGLWPDDQYVYTRWDALRPMTLRVGYSPVRFVTLYGGGGFETAERNPVALAAISLHTRGTVRITGGFEVMYLGAEYVRREVLWESQMPVLSTVVEETRHWKRSTSMWLGVELGVPLPGR